MKKSSLILVIIFLITMVSFQRTAAQEKSKEEIEKEVQKAIDDQKKALVEQKKIQDEAQREARKDLEESQADIEKAMEKIRIAIPSDQDMMKIYQDAGRARFWSNGDAFNFTPGGDFYGRHFGEDSERTNWEFSKFVKETSFSRDYTFDVESTVKTVIMAVNGDCKEGEIRIKIIAPGGKTYSDIVIDEFGNLNWRKSFNISETENKDKTGAWKFEINSSKASGYFKISLQTY